MSADQLRSTYNTIAADYHKEHITDAWNNDYIVLFCSLLPAGAHVLDLGCGPGTDTSTLVNAGFKLDGFDLSDELLAIARTKNPSVAFTQGDMRKLPYTPGMFDGVFAKASLLHIPKKELPAVLQEIWRVLKPGGIVQISVKKGEGESELTEDDYGYSYTRFFAYWTSEEMRSALNLAGFSVEHGTETPIPGKKTVWIKLVARKKAG